jgi:hypothetical protein
MEITIPSCWKTSVFGKNADRTTLIRKDFVFVDLLLSFGDNFSMFLVNVRIYLRIYKA